jgi:hypothetical protein
MREKHLRAKNLSENKVVKSHEFFKFSRAKKVKKKKIVKTHGLYFFPVLAHASLLDDNDGRADARHVFRTSNGSVSEPTRKPKTYYYQRHGHS